MSFLDTATQNKKKKTHRLDLKEIASLFQQQGCQLKTD